MKHISYLGYIIKHKSRVFVHSVVLGVPIRGLIHDLSKFHPIEWMGIGRQFYSSNEEEKKNNVKLFKEARAHHIARNEHEVEYWYCDDGSCKPIPHTVLLETMADWAAFGGLCYNRADIQTEAMKSYERFGKNFKMHSDTHMWIEQFLEIESSQNDTLKK